ncbi:hypothetical protein IWW48_001758 [Coemansia sp. RSA 1200]|nr:hypothetical protein IWW48_001758 [Coemansia sp. RSA 1200]
MIVKPNSTHRSTSTTANTGSKDTAETITKRHNTRYRLETSCIYNPDGEDRKTIGFAQKRRWLPEEEEKLVELIYANVSEQGVIDWDGVSKQLEETHGTSRTVVACHLRYGQIVKFLKQAKEDRALHYTRIAETAARRAHGLSKFPYMLGSTSVRKQTWSPEDDRALLELVSACGFRWKRVSEMMENKFLPTGCRYRYWLLTKRKDAAQQRGAADHTRVPISRPSHDNTSPPAGGGSTPERVRKYYWSKEHDRKLFDLLGSAEHVSGGVSAICKHFPEFTVTKVYNAVARLGVEPNRALGRWSAEENAALMDLLRRHGTNRWIQVSREMPTTRTPAQCRLHYRTTGSVSATYKRTWTRDEFDRLRDLVHLHLRGKLAHVVPLAASATTAMDETYLRMMQQQQQLAGTPSHGLLLSGRRGGSDSGFRRMVVAAELDARNAASKGEHRHQGKEEDRASGSGPIISKRIPWSLISLHMGTRSAVQCQRKWNTERSGFYNFLSAKDNSSSSNAEEKERGSAMLPWSLEEDMQLYKLYNERPGKWKWISSGLSAIHNQQQRQRQPRTYYQIIRRHTSYVGKYVAMLRQCRGALWDPLDDGFEEVHMRCEILAWYRGALHGYRPTDPAKCPYDLDLTGFKSWTQTG